MNHPFNRFPITSLCRADLEKAGFDALAVEDATMKKLAEMMAGDYCEQLFWDQQVASGFGWRGNPFRL